MFKNRLLFLVVYLKLTIVRSESFTSERILLSKNARFRPLTTKICDQLVYATFMSYPAPKIKIEYEKIGYEPCEINFESMYEIQYPIDIDSLANGEMILSVLGETTSGFRYLNTLIINLEKCKFNAVKTPLKASLASNPTYRELIAFVCGEKEFDIFLTNHSSCSEEMACRLRFDEKGALINATDFDLPHDVDSWSIKSVKEKDFSSGYFYTIFASNGTTIKRLDQDLQVITEQSAVKSFLYWDTYGSINYCLGTSNYELNCEFFDQELKSRMSAVIDTRLYKNYLRHIQLFNLPDQSALLFLILQVSEDPSDSSFSSYLQRIDQHGRSVSLVRFQDRLCKDFGEISMAKMRDNFFCFSVSCRDAVMTKCVVF